MKIRDCGNLLNWSSKPHCRSSFCKDGGRSCATFCFKALCFQLDSLFLLQTRKLVLQGVDLGILLDRIIKALIQGMFFMGASTMKLRFSRGTSAVVQHNHRVYYEVPLAALQQDRVAVPPPHGTAPLCLYRLEIHESKRW